nr:integrin alpha [uncultured Dongia sp.]
MRIDGGNGIDTVKGDGFGAHLSLTENLRGRFQDIEIVDLSGTEANNLSLDRANVTQLAGSNGSSFGANTLLVRGDAEDVLTFADAGWVEGGVVVNPYGKAGSYTSWTNGTATVLLETGVGVSANNIDLATLTASLGFKISGAADVGSAGDINADGIDDLVVSADQSYVIFGQAGGSGDIDLATLTSSQGFIISRTAAGDESGLDARLAGDVNGDGIDDLIVGAAFADTAGGADAGESYVVFGKEGGPNSFDVTTMSAAQGFKISGAAADDWSGLASCSAGDFNGDGVGDILVSARNADPFGRYYAGESYVIYGKQGGSGDIDLAALTVAEGFKISGANSLHYSGWSLSSAGDVNGDGLDDVIVGAPIAGAQVGFAYVIYGQEGGSSDIDLAALTTDHGFRISGFDNDDFVGNSVSGAGDINGDGIDDFVVGAYRGGYGASGLAYFVYGKEGGLGNVDLTTLTADQGVKAFGFDVNDVNAQIGRSVSLAGDVNGDGIDDVIIGAPRIDALGRERSGESYLIYGREGSGGDINLETLTMEQGFRISGAAAYDRSGLTVSAAGDINGDGRRFDRGCSLCWFGRRRILCDLWWQFHGVGDTYGNIGR